MPLVSLACLAVLVGGTVVDVAAGEDWTTTGWDCQLFAAGDIDGDGLAEIVTVNGLNALCMARSVSGWKAGGWEVLRAGVPAGATDLAVVDLDPTIPGCEVLIRYIDQTLLFRRTGVVAFDGGVPFEGAFPVRSIAPGRVTPPPYEERAPIHDAFAGDIDGDGRVDAIAVFTASRPHQHRVVRVAVALREGNGGDLDGDGVSDEREEELGSDSRDRDTDDDGLLDGWEVNGLPRGIEPFEGPLSPTRQDVLLVVSRFEGLDEAVAKREVERSRSLYAALPTRNPDGSTGVTVHLRWTKPIPLAEQGSWWSVGNRVIAPRERGIVHWMQVTPGGGGQAQQTGDMGSAGAHWAAFGHEVGHQLSLSHEGDSTPAWCPLYPSLMNYAFNYTLGGDPNAIRFSDGRFASVELLESSLVERLPFAHQDLRYLESPPFRFTLKADGEKSTLIDWNHNGRFDEGTVEADINYGGSTHCGIRRNVETVAAAPSLFLLDDVAQLLTVDMKCTAVSIRACEGDGRWSAPRPIPNSATRHDPVGVGVGDAAYVFFRSQRSWWVAKVTASAIETPMELPELRTTDLSACEVDGRVLIVTRDDSDALVARWFDWGASERLSAPQPLERRSRVAPGLAQDPDTKRLVLATSDRSPKGHDWCLRVTWFAVEGMTLREEASRWTRGEAAVNHCTTRPVVVFRPNGPTHELNLFHTGWFGPSGLTTAWRTRQVGNQALDDGWLTCLLYDEWTLTRVGVAFVCGPQGAIYSYRWDPVDHGDMTVNMLQTAHNGWGIDREPMRDFDDGAKITRWGIRHSILFMRPD
jgi:hypothetical protein